MKKLLWPTLIAVMFNCSHRSDVREGPELVYSDKFGLINSSTTIFDGFVYFGDDTRKMKCVSLKTSGYKWAVELEENLYLRPVLVDGLLVTTLNNGTIYFISNEGKVVFKTNLKGRIKKKPVVWKDFVIFSVRGVGIVSINVRTKKISTLISNIRQDTSSQPAISDQYLFVGDINEKFICFDLVSSQTIWEVSIPNCLQSSPTIVGDSIILLTENLLTHSGQLFQINLKNGKYNVKEPFLDVDTNYKPINFQNRLFFQSKSGVIDNVPLTVGISKNKQIIGHLMSNMIEYNGNLVFALTDFNIYKMDSIGELSSIVSADGGVADPFIQNGMLYAVYENSVFTISF